MVKRQTWILLAVFVVLIGLAFFWTRYQNDQKRAHPTPTPTPEINLFTIDSSAVASLKITDNVGGKTVMVGRDISGQWALVDPQAEYTDIASVEAAVTQLASLRVTSSISTTENLSEYGLDKPAYTIMVNINSGGQLIAQVGSPTATSSGYYVQVPGGVPQIVAKYSIDAVLKLLLKPPIATPTVAPTMTGVITPTAVTTATLVLPSSTPNPLPAATDTLTPTYTNTQLPSTSTTAPQATATSVAVTPTETEKP
jgi:hypothetical protein